MPTGEAISMVGKIESCGPIFVKLKNAWFIGISKIAAIPKHNANHAKAATTPYRS
jgi:hypothetical protein